MFDCQTPMIYISVICPVLPYRESHTIMRRVNVIDMQHVCNFILRCSCFMLIIQWLETVAISVDNTSVLMGTTSII